MKDVQNERDERNIPINKVGIKGLRYPISIKDISGSLQSTVAFINMYVDLSHESKGTHMSRFVEIIHVLSLEGFSIEKIPLILKEIKKNLSASSAHVDISFPYFLEKKAPISHSVGFMDYNCRFMGSIDPNDNVDLISGVSVPISSVCPCSKEISNGGAHNQRGKAKLQIRSKQPVLIESMIKLVEACASSEIYSILKRSDEKYVTELGFSNPKFVEDLVRDISKCIRKDDNITWFSVSAENFESIHNHNAYAYIEH